MICFLYDSGQTSCDPVHLAVHWQVHLNICKSGHQAKTCSTFASYVTTVGLSFATWALFYVRNDLGKSLEGEKAGTKFYTIVSSGLHFLIL